MQALPDLCRRGFTLRVDALRDHSRGNRVSIYAASSEINTCMTRVHTQREAQSSSPGSPAHACTNTFARAR
jgi:hypothetical protein